jgi:hypothetical protein
VATKEASAEGGAVIKESARSMSVPAVNLGRSIVHLIVAQVARSPLGLRFLRDIGSRVDPTLQKGARGEHCDMLVIGSLLGGSVAALELTEKGDRLRISAVWRKRYDKDFAETTWRIERFAWPPRGRKGMQCIYFLARVLVHAGVGIGSRVLQRIRNSRPFTNGARTASTDSESAASVMPTASSSNTMATIYSIVKPRGGVD